MAQRSCHVFPMQLKYEKYVKGYSVYNNEIFLLWPNALATSFRFWYRYKNTVRDLLRLIRNKRNHYHVSLIKWLFSKYDTTLQACDFLIWVLPGLHYLQEFPENVKKSLGTIPEGYLAYFCTVRRMLKWVLRSGNGLCECVMSTVLWMRAAAWGLGVARPLLICAFLCAVMIDSVV